MTNQINQCSFDNYYQSFAKRHSKRRTHILKQPEQTEKRGISYQVQPKNPKNEKTTGLTKKSKKKKNTNLLKKKRKRKEKNYFRAALPVFLFWGPPPPPHR